MSERELDPAFVDITGRRRELRFDINAARRANVELGVKLSDIFLGDLEFRIRTENVLAVDLAHIASDVEDPISFAKLVGLEKLSEVAEAVIAAAVVFSAALVNSDVPKKVARANAETFGNMLELTNARAKPIPSEQLETLVELATSGFGSSWTPPIASPGSSASIPGD